MHGFRLGVVEESALRELRDKLSSFNTQLLREFEAADKEGLGKGIYDELLSSKKLIFTRTSQERLIFIKILKDI